MKIIRLSLVCALCSLMVAEAQVPGTLSYQGILMQNDGITPIADGAHSIVFNFYTTSSGGIALFSRTISVTTTKGLYTCIIGGGIAPNAPFIATEKNQLGSLQIFIGIAVDGGSELLPRAQLTTSPYSLRSESITDTANPAGGNVSFWGANNTLSSDAGLSWDNTNKRLGIAGIAGPLDINDGGYNAIISSYTQQFLRPGINYFWANSAGGHFYFTVNGNGQTNASMVIRANGNVGIGTVSPATPLHLKGNANVLRLEGTDHCYIEFYPDGPATRKAYFGFEGATDNDFHVVNQISGANIVLNTTGSGNIVSDGHVRPNITSTYSLGTASYRWDNIYYTGAFNPSDIRIKKDIDNLSYGLTEIKKLEPKKYKYIDAPNQATHFGLIAQDLVKVIPELVSIDDKGEKLMSVNYVEFIPILINSIKEQQTQIEELKTELAEFKSMKSELTEIKRLLSHNVEGKMARSSGKE